MSFPLLHRREMWSWYPLAWNGLAHPIVATDTMAYTSIVEHALSRSAVFRREATLAQLALVITNILVLFFALFMISLHSFLLFLFTSGETYDYLPDRQLLWIHSAVVVGLGFWFLAAQTQMEHCDDVEQSVGYGGYVRDCCDLVL